MMTQILMMMVMEKVEVKKVKADCDSLQQIFTESKMDTSKPQTSYKLIFNCELSMIYILQMRIHQGSVFFFPVMCDVDFYFMIFLGKF